MAEVGEPMRRTLSLPPAVTAPPLYILESSLESQELWYATAGRRPQQPEEERKYYENLWRQNFEVSSVQYKTPIYSMSSPSQKNSKNNSGGSNANNDIFHSSEEIVYREYDYIPFSQTKGEIIYREKCPFSNSVSRSFPNSELSSMTIRISHFRIFNSLENNEIHAEFLIVACIEHKHRLTFGNWKRHTEFSEFAKKLRKNPVLFENSLLSWDYLMQHKKWYKCLNKDYLIFKTILLEKFLQDVLFESNDPLIISEFLDLDKNETGK